MKNFVLLISFFFIYHLCHSQESFDSIMSAEIQRYDLFRSLNSNNLDIKYSVPIKRRLAEHKKWLESNQTQGQQFVATHENLTGYDFTHSDLRKAQFVDCNLNYASFRTADLSSGCLFINCNLHYTSFISANMNNTQFLECDTYRTTFFDANLTNANITGKQQELLKDTLFNIYYKANLTDAVFTFTSFQNCDYENLIISNTRFIQSNLSFFDFSKVKMNSSLILIKSIVSYSKMNSLFIPGNVFSNCTFISSEIRNSDLTGSNFDKCDLRSVSFNSSTLKDCLFTECNCESCNLNSATITNAEARLNNFKLADFRLAHLENSDFSGCVLTNAIIDNTTNRNLTNFSGATWINGKTCKTSSIGICIEIQ
jgi:fluoroquinolone resistance protein